MDSQPDAPVAELRQSPPAILCFSKLEQLIASHDARWPLYVLPHVMHGVGTAGVISLSEWHITVADIDDRGVVRLWRKKTGACKMIHGKAFEPGSDDRQWTRTDAAYGIVISFIAEWDFNIQGALPAIPKDFVILSGDTEIMKYDEPTDSYVETEAYDQLKPKDA